jgi:hypothetical protein
MRLIKFLIIAFVVVSVFSCERNSALKSPYTIMFYNVENLFDTIDAKGKIDEEFLPQSVKQWNTERYFKKIDDLAQVISRVDTIQLPVMVGFCEVENNTVLSDLASQRLLKAANYKVVWVDGSDRRGIDCALLYNPLFFKPLNVETLPVADPDDESFITRDILYVEGKIKKEVFHIFINHWPSRRGGENESEPYRILAANTLRNKVEQLFSEKSDANIIIMGDMNDEPSNMSLSDILMALPNDKKPAEKQLVNLMYDEYLDGKGSYSYRGDWDMIDHVIVSSALFNKSSGLKSPLDNGYVFHEPFMEYVNDSEEMSPNRTYGRTYYGGISDHFPVYMVLSD